MPWLGDGEGVKVEVLREPRRRFCPTSCLAMCATALSHLVGCAPVHNAGPYRISDTMDVAATLDEPDSECGLPPHHSPLPCVLYSLTDITCHPYPWLPLRHINSRNQVVRCCSAAASRRKGTSLLRPGKVRDRDERL